MTGNNILNSIRLIIHRHATVLALVVVTLMFVPIFAGAQSSPGGAEGQLGSNCNTILIDGTGEHEGSKVFKDPCEFKDIRNVLKNVMDFIVLYIMAPMAGLSFGVAGFLYIVSGANPGQKEKAKELMLDTILGIVIVLSAWLLVWTITKGLGIKADFTSLTDK